MARKQKRRYFPTRRNTGRGRPDAAERQGQIDAAAQQLASEHSLDELRALLAQRAMLYEEADQAGTYDPSPANLARYHATRQAWQIAQRAVELASAPDRP